jgi:tetratricopeptide (TPR) repeat protein/TolB-like protein
MTADRWEHLKRVVESVLDADPSQRDTALESLCEGDDELRAEAERLVQEYLDMGGTFLEKSPIAQLQKTGVDVGQVLAGRFRLLRRLGRGGMGEVFEAADDQLMGRRVAVKMVRPDRASPHLLHRLKQEVLLAREIAHPNVCPIYDLFECDGPSGRLHFFTMRLVEGETLKARLARAGTIPAEAALVLARQMADALDTAHSRGVVHRDFKPGNVMLEPAPGGECAVVMDFGLARSTNPSDSVFRSVTQTQFIAGTPEYMAPEQLRGGTITGAADIYAFGLVLFEMVTGRRPGGPSEAAGAKLPGNFGRVVAKCLAEDPAARYTSARAAVDDLEGPRRPKLAIPKWGIAALVLLAVGAVAWMLAGRFAGPVGPQRLAVMPFESAGGDSADRALAEGVMDRVAAELADAQNAGQQFSVIPAADVRQRKPRSVAEAGNLFGVNRALTGKFRRQGSDVLVDLELHSAPGGGVIGRRTARCSSAEVYRLAGLTGAEAARLLRIRLPEDRADKVLLGGTKNARAYQEFELARSKLNEGTLTSSIAASEHYLKALDVDASYALAYAGLAEALAAKYHYTKELEALDLARRQIDRAVQLAPGAPDVHLAASAVYLEAGENDRALQSIQRAMALDPSNLGMSTTLARVYERLGRVEEAEATHRKVIETKPHFMAGYQNLGEFYWKRGKYAESEKMFTYVLTMVPDSVLAHNNLAAAYLITKRYDKAIPLLRKSVSIVPTGQAYNNLGNAYFLLGRYREALEPMEKAAQLEPRNHARWRNLGDICQLVPERRGETVKAYARAAELAGEIWRANPNDVGTGTNLALYLAKLGKRTEALAVLAQTDRIATSDLNIAFRKVATLELAGERERALVALEKLLAAGFSEDQIRKAPELERLRTDPGFRNMMARR